MEAVRIATPEEIEAIKDHSDLTSATSVVTYGGRDFAVIRQCFEVDPMWFHEESSVKRKLLFAMNLETLLRFQGVKEIYFNVPVRDEAYMTVLKTWGAEPTSLEPELRFKKVL
jgi:hypothetical protein